MISRFHGPLDIVDRTHQNDLMKFAVPHSGTHGVAERALDLRKNAFIQWSLTVESRINLRVVRMMDETELTMLGERPHVLFP